RFRRQSRSRSDGPPYGHLLAHWLSHRRQCRSNRDLRARSNLAMKRALLIFMTAFSLLFTLAPVAVTSAEDILDPVGKIPTASGEKPTVCKENQANSSNNPLLGPNGIITVIVRWLARIIGVVAVIVIAASGISLATSGGDSNKATSARRAIVY